MLRWAILGTSFISDTIMQAIAASDGSEAVIVAGRDEDKLRAFQAKHSIPDANLDFDAAIAHPNVDMVYIGLPSHLHQNFALKAAAAGKAVLSEKSLTVDMPSAHGLVAGMQLHNTFFVEGLMYLAHPFLARFRDVLMDGRLGTIRAINGFYAANIAGTENPMGKGTLYNLGCYPASLLHLIIQTMFGEDAFRNRQTSGHGTFTDDGGTLTDAVLSARFGGGVLATLQSTDTYGMAHGFTVMGEHGTLAFKTNPWLPVAGDNILVWQPYDGEQEEITVTDPHDAFYHQIKMVERCIAEGQIEVPRPSPRLSDSLEIMELLTDWEEHCMAGHDTAPPALEIEVPPELIP